MGKGGGGGWAGENRLNANYQLTVVHSEGVMTRTMMPTIKNKGGRWRGAGVVFLTTTFRFVSALRADGRRSYASVAQYIYFNDNMAAK